MLSLRALSKSRALTRTLATAPSALQNVSPAQFSARMVAAATTGRFGDALDIAVAMKKQGVPPDRRTYDSLLSCAANEGHWLFTWAIFDDMVASGFKPTASSFLPLLKAQCENSQSVANIWTVLAKMEEYAVKPTSAIYTVLFEHYSQPTNIEPSLRLYFEMKRQGLVPELAAAQTLVNMLAECRYPRIALEIALEYEGASARSIPDHIWCEILASAAENLDHEATERAWQTVVTEREVLISEYIALAVLNTAVRHNNPALATKVLESLRSIGVSWREHHFAGVISTMCGSDKFKEAFITLNLMRNEGIEPTGDTYLTITNAICSDVDSLDAAWNAIDQVWTEMPDHLDIAALNAVMAAAIKLGDLQRAVAIYKGFDDYSMARNIETYNMLIDGAITASHRQLGDLVMEDMKEAKVMPNTETFEKIIKLCLTQDTYEDAFFYLEEMKEAQHLPPRAVYDAILAKCMEVDDPRTAMVVQEMKECGYQPVDQRVGLAVNTIKRRQQNPPHKNRPRRRQGESASEEQQEQAQQP